MTQLSHALPVFQMHECGMEHSDPASLARGVKDSSERRHPFPAGLAVDGEVWASHGVFDMDVSFS